MTPSVHARATVLSSRVESNKVRGNRAEQDQLITRE